MGKTKEGLGENKGISLQLPLTNVNNGKTSVEDRFWAKVLPVTESGCWIWVGSLDSAGYGLFKVGVKLHKAHRFSYYLSNGEIPDELNACHRCDTPCCVNPSHLFLGTDTDNMHDRDRKGRQISPSRKLTAEQVAEIRQRAIIGVDSWDPFSNAKRLAEEYGVARTTIYHIVSKRTWK